PTSCQTAPPRGQGGGVYRPGAGRVKRPPSRGRLPGPTAEVALTLSLEVAQAEVRPRAQVQELLEPGRIAREPEPDRGRLAIGLCLELGQRQVRERGLHAAQAREVRRLERRAHPVAEILHAHGRRLRAPGGAGDEPAE